MAITIDKRVMGGVPCIGGTRIPVVTVIRALAQPAAWIQDVLIDYPDLSIDDIREALHWAADKLEAP